MVPLSFGTGDFTVEWFQYQKDDNATTRIFSVGIWPNESMAASIENGVFYWWANGSNNAVVSIPNHKNRWIHFAVCRSGTTTTLYVNGVNTDNWNDSNNYANNRVNLYIGNELLTSDCAYGGYLYYFAMYKGYAKYTSNFTPSYTAYPDSTDTRLVYMVSALGQSGTLTATPTDYTYTNNNVSTVPITPSPYDENVEGVYVNNFFAMRSLFSNNSLVYYKPGTFGGSTGTSINSRVKSHRC